MTQEQESYATWAVRLWLDNEEGLYRLFREYAEDIRTEYETRDRRIHALAVLIQESFEEAAHEATGVSIWEGAIRDILAHADIDYERVADLFAGELFNDEEDDE